MQKYAVHFWKQTPFLRLLTPFILGVILQWYFQLSIVLLFLLVAVSVLTLMLFFLVSDRIKFSFGWLQGIAVQFILFAIGALLTYNKDIRHNKSWIGRHYKDSSAVLVTIKEPLVEKTKSFKATASVEAVQVNGGWQPVEGKILIYFKKDSTQPQVDYGSKIIFTQPLQSIKSSGNPGAFDYQRYCAFQDIYHQVFLKDGQYFNTQQTEVNRIWSWLFDVRQSVIKTLQEYIKPEREAGVAEALLIGYRDDLDKDLVQAYSNTGVVHIIAISGLHLGLIYGMLIGFFQFFRKRRWVKVIRPVTILVVLWTFTLIAGAAPSILRSAVMFTGLVLGETIDRKSSVYNNLAASAFIMLCYNPFFLWDVGFQLSYAALVSIVMFRDYVYNWFFIENKALDRFWRLNAVTISAQILTLPFILYHFHQFPNLFLVTNIVAVPLSGFILYGELALLVFSKAEVVAILIGKVCSMMIWVMNAFVERLNELPFALTDNLQFTVVQAILIAFITIAISYWLITKKKTYFFAALVSISFFIVTVRIDSYHRNQQRKLIVYNIPQHTAIDFIDGGGYQFLGDTSILADNFTTNFHLKPSRTLHQVKPLSLEGLYSSYPFTQFENKRILLIDKPLRFEATTKIPIDVIIISKNPRVYINEVLEAFDCKQFVFDSSNPAWKINLWKKDCDNLHLRHHSTAEKGAFVMEL